MPASRPVSRPRLTRIFGALALGVACLVVSGCESTAYYAQAVGGHAGILAKREPIVDVIDDPATSETVRQQLRRVLALREYAGSELGLPLEGQYDTYVQLDSPYAIWNVFASPELSLNPRLWCYPVAGCAAYRGYYDRDDAEEYAGQLREEGFDVFLGGVAAYSTLGWFSDPILSTFIRLPERDLADLLFHELAHQVLYVKGDTMFNESFATVVAAEGVRRWLLAENNPEAWQQFTEDRERSREFIDIVTTHRDRLEEAFESGMSDDEKREAKARIIEDLRAAHETLRQSWGGESRYDGWFALDLNNAQLNAVAAYHELTPSLEALLESVGRDLPRFYDEVRGLAELDFDARRTTLAEIASNQEGQ